MSKAKIKITIENSEINDTLEVSAIIQEEIIKYQEKDSTKVIYDYNRKKLVRENNQMKMTYYFDNKTESNILVKEYDRYIKPIIKTDSIRRSTNNIEIKYSIENEKFTYRIEEVK